jgi:hypothetical protein
MALILDPPIGRRARDPPRSSPSSQLPLLPRRTGQLCPGGQLPPRLPRTSQLRPFRPQAPPTARPWPRRRHRPTAGPPPAADPPPPRPPLYSENPHQRCRSGFTTLPPVSLLEQYRCGSFVGGAQIVEELANREYGGHEDLCGSARQSVIPYVHGRKELY